MHAWTLIMALIWTMDARLDLNYDINLDHGATQVVSGDGPLSTFPAGPPSARKSARATGAPGGKWPVSGNGPVGGSARSAKSGPPLEAGAASAGFRGRIRAAISGISRGDCDLAMGTAAAALRRRCQKFARRPRDRPRRGPNALKAEKKTTQRLL